jgi:hypothetical protein
MTGMDIRDISMTSSGKRSYEDIRGEVNALDRRLKEAEESGDRGLIRAARDDIRQYKGYAKKKSRVQYARTQLSEVNKSIKALELKQEEGKRFTAFDERRLNVLKKRREKIYMNFDKVINR